MFGINIKKQDDDKDFLDLTEKVIMLTAELKDAGNTIDALVDANKKLGEEVEAHKALSSTMAELTQTETDIVNEVIDNKSPVNSVMLEALKLAAPCLDRYGKVHPIVENAIKEGEAAL